MTRVAQISPPTHSAERTPLLEVMHTMLAAAWRRRFVILIPALLMPIAGLVTGMFAPKSYEARMSLLVQHLGQDNPLLRDISIGSNLKDRMDSLRALLNSHRILIGVGEDLGMLPANAPPDLADQFAESLGKAVNVQLIGDDMLEFTYRAGAPKGMDKTLSRIAQRFVERLVAPEDTSTHNSVEFLATQLADARKGLEKAEAGLAEFRSRHVQELPETRSATLARLATLRDQMSDHQIQLAGALSELDALRSRLGRTDPIIGRLEQEIVDATSELAGLRARYTEEHSAVQAAERKLANLEALRIRMLSAQDTAQPVDLDKLWNMAATTAATPGNQDHPPLLVSQVAILQQANGKVEQLRAEAENLRQNVATLERQLAASGEVEREQRERERDVATNSDVVTELQKRAELARVTRDLSRFQAPERVKVVDPPTEPTQPLRPMVLLFAVAGLLGGIAFGLGLAVALEMLDPSVRRALDMERITGAPVLARLPLLVGT